MKEKEQAISCSECSHCSGFRLVGNTRTEFTCTHPDQRYIQDYFSRKNMRKMPGFIGFGERYSEEVPVRTAPAWCPKKIGTGNARLRSNRGDAAQCCVSPFHFRLSYKQIPSSKRTHLPYRFIVGHSICCKVARNSLIVLPVKCIVTKFHNHRRDINCGLR